MHHMTYWCNRRRGHACYLAQPNGNPCNVLQIAGTCTGVSMPKSCAVRRLVDISQFDHWKKLWAITLAAASTDPCASVTTIHSLYWVVARASMKTKNRSANPRKCVMLSLPLGTARRGAGHSKINQSQQKNQSCLTDSCSMRLSCSFEVRGKRCKIVCCRVLAGTRSAAHLVFMF